VDMVTLAVMAAVTAVSYFIWLCVGVCNHFCCLCFAFLGLMLQLMPYAP
jgi:hypothetical protein